MTSSVSSSVSYCSDNSPKLEPSFTARGERSGKLVSSQKICKYVNFDEKKYHGLTDASLFKRTRQDFTDCSEPTTLLGRNVSYGILIKVELGDVIWGILDFATEEHQQYRNEDSDLEGFIEASINRYDLCLFERGEEGKITTVFDMTPPVDLSESSLAAIAEIGLKAADAPSVAYNKLTNFSLYNTDAKIEYISVREYNEAHKKACALFNIPHRDFSFPELASKKGESSCCTLF